MRRVLLLLNTSTYRAEAFLSGAARLGVAVTVGSNQPQVLERFHHDGHLTLDFNDTDGAARAIAAFAGKRPLDAVIAADDDGALIAARAGQLLGLRSNGLAPVTAARNKHLMRVTLRAAGMPSPWFECRTIDDDPNTWSRDVPFPCVLKPTFLAGSRGVIRVDTPGEFVDAFRRIAGILEIPETAARGGGWSREILAESYIPGDEIAIEGLLTGGELRVLAVFDKPDPLEGPFFEETLYVTPTRHPNEILCDAVHAVGAAASALGMRDGPVHAELRLNQGGAWLVEIAPRSIGGLCSIALRFGEDGSIPLEELLLRHALGDDVATVSRERAAAGVMMIPLPRGGVLHAVHGVREAEGIPLIESVRLTAPLGSVLVLLPEGGRYLGFIFARGAHAAEVEEALRAAHARLEFAIVDADHVP